MLSLLGCLPQDDGGLADPCFWPTAVDGGDDARCSGADQFLVQRTVFGNERVTIFSADRLERWVAGQDVVGPFLQQRAFDDLRDHVGCDAFGDAELDRNVESVSG